MEDCSKTKADWDKLKHMAEAFENPKTFAFTAGKNLLVNGKEIYGEITNAVDAYKAEDWHAFGFNTGEAAAKIIFGEEQARKIDAEKLKGIVGGLIMGALDAEGFDDIVKCIKCSEHIFFDVEEAVKDFE